MLSYKTTKSSWRAKLRWWKRWSKSELYLWCNAEPRLCAEQRAQRGCGGAVLPEPAGKWIGSLDLYWRANHGTRMNWNNRKKFTVLDHPLDTNDCICRFNMILLSQLQYVGTHIDKCIHLYIELMLKGTRTPSEQCQDILEQGTKAQMWPCDKLAIHQGV